MSAKRLTKTFKDLLMLPININTFLISQRSAGYTLTEAISELIDNSIQAESNYFQIDQILTGKSINKLVFSDDGHGMDLDVLHKYLVMGESTNWLKNKGIGKFGVGAKVSAYCVCKRITIYSRVKGSEGDYYSTSYDLDVVMNSNDVLDIEKPVATKLPKDVALFVREDANTVVVWDKLDKLPKRTLSAVNNDIRCELGRMFRKFIYAGFEISLSGNPIRHFDPTMQLPESYNNEVLTKAYVGEHARIRNYEPQYFAQDFVIAKRGDEEVKLTITLMPNEITRTPGKGGDALAKALRLKQNQGRISFLRSGREIGYSSYHNAFGRAAIAEDRFIGIEIKFNGEFDDAFGTKMIKRGVEPNPELKLKITEALKTYLPIASKTLKQRWSGASEAVDFEAAEKAVERLENMFNSVANQDLKNKENIADRMSKLLTLANEVGISDSNEYLERKSSRPYVIEETNELTGGTFLDFETNEKQILIRINKSHSIYKTTWLPMQQVSQMGTDGEIDASQTARHSLQSLNLMIIAFAKCTSENPEFSTFIEHWSKQLEKLLRQIEISK